MCRCNIKIFLIIYSKNIQTFSEIACYTKTIINARIFNNYPSTLFENPKILRKLLRTFGTELFLSIISQIVKLCVLIQGSQYLFQLFHIPIYEAIAIHAAGLGALDIQIPVIYKKTLLRL